MSLKDSMTIYYPGIIFKQEYKIDKEGTIWSPWRGWHEMYQHENKQGYKELYLYTEDGRKCFKVHRLVLSTFNPISEEDMKVLQVNHKDGNKGNNNLDNLEWCTRSENLLHAFSTGLEAKPKGEKNPKHKLTEQEVREICERLQDKESGVNIAKIYGVSKSCISSIKNKRTWIDIVKDYNFD